jgi:hypothetical protein
MLDFEFWIGDLGEEKPNGEFWILNFEWWIEDDVECWILDFEWWMGTGVEF